MLIEWANRSAPAAASRKPPRRGVSATRSNRRRPLLEPELLAHDSYSCELFPGSRPFPTRRPADFQHVGQVFDAAGEPRMGDIDGFLRGNPAPAACRGEPEWTYG